MRGSNISDKFSSLFCFRLEKIHHILLSFENKVKQDDFLQ